MKKEDSENSVSKILQIAEKNLCESKDNLHVEKINESTYKLSFKKEKKFDMEDFDFFKSEMYENCMYVNSDIDSRNIIIEDFVIDKEGEEMPFDV